MSEPTASPGDPLDAVIAAYVQQVEAGAVPDREALLAAHPDLADRLREFFADYDRLERQAAELRLSADPERTREQAGAPGADAAGLAGLPRVRYFGDYELLEVIARGGMGVVYKARQVSLNRMVALKMILKGELATPRDLARFRAEAEAAANLDHPNIVPIYEVGEHDGQQYYAMRYVEGTSLSGRPRADSRSEARLVAAVAGAVHHAHRRGVLHRDIKPSNILVDSAGTPLVADFGLAKRVDADRSLTESGAVVGTPRYMAPEQAAGRKDLTVAADVYSLGVVLYERLTGRTPFTGETVLAVLRQVRETEPPRPSSLCPGLDRDLETVCLKCLEKEPGKRYASAEGLADDLARWLRGEPIVARPSSIRERVVRWAKRRPAAAALIGVSGAALLSIGALAGVLWHQAEMRARADRLQATTERQQNQRLQEQATAQRRLNARLQEQRDLVIEREKQARHYLYAAHIGLAQQALEIGHAQRALELLRLQQPRDGQEDLRSFEWYHLWHRCHRERMTLRGVQGVAVVSPTGKVVAAPVARGDIRLWALPAGREYRTLRGHQSPVQCLAFSSDGRTLATASADGAVKLWDLAAARERATLRGHTKPVNVIRFSPDNTTLVTGDESGTVILWDAAKRAARATFVDRHVAALSAVFGRGGKALYTRDAQGVVKFRDGHTGREIATLRGFRGMISCEAISPDGRTLATGTVTTDSRLANYLYGFDVRMHRTAPFPSTSGEVILWDAATGKKVVTLGTHDGMVTSVAFAPDGKTLGSASTASPMLAWQDLPHQMSDVAGQLKLWDLAVRKERASQAQPRGLNSLAFSPDGKVLAGAAGPFGEIDIWDARTGRPHATLVGHTAAVSALGYTPDSRTLLSAADDNTLRLWDADAPPEPLAIHHGSVMSRGNTVFLPGGKTIVTGLSGSPVFRYDSHNGQELGLLSFWSVGPVAVSSDGRTLATATLPPWSDVILWDTASWRQRRTLKSALDASSFTGPQHALALSPGGQLVATAGWDDCVRLWYASTAKCYTTGGPSPGVQSVAFAPDGATFATGAKDGTVALWDMNTWKARARWSAHKDEVCALGFSPDGKTLATGCGDPMPNRTTAGEAKLWDAATGKLLAPLKGHLGPVTAVAFTPDGRRLATASADRTVKLWDVVSGQCLLTLTGHGQTVDGVTFRSDGKLLATTARDGTVRLWHAASAEELKARDE
jgi:WD40 repeat protein/tRNA A-37 threonylcarbamoyl transferase component Bud32